MVSAQRLPILGSLSSALPRDMAVAMLTALHLMMIRFFLDASKQSQSQDYLGEPTDISATWRRWVKPFLIDLIHGSFQIYKMALNSTDLYM